MTAQDTILVIDDDRLSRTLLSTGLQEQGYTVETAEDGPHALEILRARPFDLVLLDILMPGMDGFQVCQQLQADDNTRDIPIILISALDETENIVKAFTVGGVDYITKPFHLEEVLARVETHMALQKLRRQLQETNDELAERLKELAHSNAELQARNEELDAYAHTVAHDLKKPLHLVTGYTELLIQDFDHVSKEEAHQSLRMVAKGARKLNDIIESLLLLALLRQMEVKTQAVDMASVVAEVRTNLRAMIEDYQAEIVLPERWPAAIGYAPWVEEVWTNYISNAIKYGGRPPRVELGAEIVDAPSRLLADASVSESVPETGSEKTARFWVKDNGPGLAAEARARLFIPFERLGQVQVEGHGLGLSIVRRIVEKLGGQAGSESTPGQGSTFWFTLPAGDSSG
ncbi:MAG: response regulator [Thermoflexales bacterium]|nr:response regulator [Thermoflexales bacterium]